MGYRNLPQREETKSLPCVKGGGTACRDGGIVSWAGAQALVRDGFGRGTCPSACHLERAFGRVETRVKRGRGAKGPLRGSRGTKVQAVVRPRFRMGLKPTALLRHAAKVRLAWRLAQNDTGRDVAEWEAGRRPWSGNVPTPFSSCFHPRYAARPTSKSLGEVAFPRATGAQTKRVQIGEKPRCTLFLV